ncbi:MAG: A24 family peptidase [Rhizobiaceae bacterium]
MLGIVIYSDLRHMRIPDRLSFLLLGLFLLLALSQPFSETGLRIAQALCVFLLCFAGYFFRLLGGGDVKILTALSLFVPLTYASEVLLVFSGTLIGGTSLVVLARRVTSDTSSDWAYLNSSKLPMGVPIGLAGLIVVGWAYFAGVQ